MAKKVLNDVKKYYLGLDIGTESIGWAVTDFNYKLLRVNNKNLWGVRLFDEAKQAKDRRMQRESRRRTERRKWRISLLQQIFAPAINVIDENYFARLDDSNLYGGDKREKTKFSLFNDANFTDIDFYKQYKTIYHLRKAMLTAIDPDPRLVYLALHHIVKYRGHFLIEGENMSAIEDIALPLEAINRFLADNEDNDCFDLSKVDVFKTLLIKKNGKSKRAQDYIDCFGVKNRKDLAAVLKLIAGNSVSIKDLPVNCDNKDLKISFDSDWENKEVELRDTLQDDYTLIENAKLLYDYSKLKSILGDYRYISQGMVDKFEKHKSDLAALKYVIRKYFSKEKYDEIFRSALKENETNYTAYTGKVKFGRKNGKKIILDIKCKSRTYDDFVKYIKLTLLSNDVALLDEVTNNILADIEAGTFMPRQVSKNNATIPYQLNLAELDAILTNVQKYSRFNFLNETDEQGISARDKVRSLLTFRMPYYVGPTNNNSSRYWIVKNNDGQILPWNYDKQIDLEQTERNFIERMTNECPYVVGAKVLPKCSLLYEEYVFLNIVNKIRINGDPIRIDLKQKLSQYYALTGKNKLSAKILKQWLIEQNEAESNDDLRFDGFDEGATVHRRMYYQFTQILGSADEVDARAKDIEEIIKYATIVGTEKGNLEKWLSANFKWLTKDQIKRIKGLTCKGWGRCSREFLTMAAGTNVVTGEVKTLSIMDVLRSTCENFMEIWNDAKYDFAKTFDENRIQISGDISYQLVDDLYCSPAVKKQAWQALTIVKELKSILGCAPAKIFVEVARGADPKQDRLEEKKRTTSRYEQLAHAFRRLQSENTELFNEEVLGHFESIEQRKEQLQNQKLYLYFMQNGVDIYTGEAIDYNHLELYDKDHIYPRSKVKDDSIHNNLVLTYRTQNATKTDVYPISADIRQNPKIVALWKSLRKQGLMTEEKYRRLTRSTELRDDELAEFINRQLVETRQSTKEVIGLLKRAFADSNCEVVWSKASNVSDFRAMQKYVGTVGMPRFVKCRELNDLHHAKDAYLNIVVGNVYNVRYGHDARFWVKNHPYDRLTSSAKLFDNDVKTKNVTAWAIGENGTMAQVEKTMRCNAVLFTRESKVGKGALFNATIEKKDENGDRTLVPLKGAASKTTKYALMSNTAKYGGYNNESRVYYMLVKYTEVKVLSKKTVNKTKYRFLGVTAKDAARLTSDADRIAYCISCGLNEPTILIDKIKIQTMFEFDGTMLSLSGMTGKQLTWRLAKQNAQDEETERYLKKVVNVVEKRKKDVNYSVCINDGISAEQNQVLYNLVVETLRSSKYQGTSSLASFANKLDGEVVRCRFKDLPLVKQCVVLNECSKALQCNALASDLSLVGEGKHCGIILTSATFETLAGMSIVHRSITGIFEKKTPLVDFDK